MAESAIAGDHRKSCYDSLTPNIRSLIESIPNRISADRETIALLRKELAFLEGHVKAYRQMVEALRGRSRFQPALHPAIRTAAGRKRNNRCASSPLHSAVNLQLP